MQDRHFACVKALRAQFGTATAALLALSLLAAPAFAQGTGSLPKPKAAPTAPKAKAAAPAAATGPNIPSAARAPEPTFDEGTAQRIAAVMMSYSALEVRGGWPTLPASA